jgi:hypothetical protein
MRGNHLIALAVAGAVIVLAAGFIWWRLLAPSLEQAHVATGYLAKTVCSCLFVDGGGVAACRADAALDRGSALAKVGLKIDNAAKTVRASLFPFASDLAVYEEGFGCTLK